MSYWPLSCNHLQNIWDKLYFSCEIERCIGKFKGKENLVRHQKSQNIMNMIAGFLLVVNNNFWRYVEITFRRYLAIILKISVRFTLKKTKMWILKFFRYHFRLWRGRYCIFANSGYVWNEKKNESKRKHQLSEFFHKEEEKKTMQQFSKK